ncbi:MAG: ATP-binding cassette domain-containing protein [Mesorhizobium sp.]|nr:MAG: ATP-binding cassette domain-containing protein [Mesorhizobium sp.]
MAHIELKNITKKFGGHTALTGLNLDIADGEFFVLLGETGAGKTTTLRMIAGLEKPTEGQVFIDGVDVADWSAAERDVALVLQQYSLYPRYTVRQNLEFPLKPKIRRLPDAEIKDRVARAARTLRIEHLLDRKTDRLSGGEMQRVSIGRAIVRKPRVFLMDEPLSALDAKLREALRTELKNLQMQLGATFLFVTHDQIEAMSMGDKVGVLNHGRIVQTGTPQEIYNNPRDTYVASFVGSPPMNLIDGTTKELHNPADMPDVVKIASIEEPWIRATILTPDDYLGGILKLCQDRRGIQADLSYVGKRAMLTYDLPLNEVVFDFYDRLKSISKGYASFDYHLTNYREGDLVKMSILVNDEPVDALSMLVHRSAAEKRGRAMCEKLKELIPQHLFKIPIQAAIGGRIIARETVSALRKDVTAKCYGGDVTRKRKLLDKQKEGKKRMRQFGKVDIPQEAFIQALKMGD